MFRRRLASIQKTSSVQKDFTWNRQSLAHEHSDPIVSNLIELTFDLLVGDYSEKDKESSRDGEELSEIRRPIRTRARVLDDENV